MRTSDLARRATRAAARLRADLGISPVEGVCPFDLAEQLGIPVQLVSLPSLEGMYSAQPEPIIVVSVERPPGRRRYTCGHELGHHVFEHGISLDELAEDATKFGSPEEFIAQCFASALMMPKLAIESAFARRGWNIAKLTAEMVFIVAQELGVGFTTLIAQLDWTLRCIPRAGAEALCRTSLAILRQRLAGFEVEHDLVVVDEHWSRRTIDVEVGDVVALPKNAQFDGDCAVLGDSPIRHVISIAPGIGSLITDERRPAVALRVSRREFTGLARYRHLEEVADDQ